MCIIVLGIRLHRRLPFFCFHNRDEVLTRNVTRLAIGKDATLAAHDAEAGGTWFGLNLRTGRFTALTNVRCRLPEPAAPLSRGHLVQRFLEEPPPVSLADPSPTNIPLEAPVAGFNLVSASLGTTPSATYLSNRTPIDRPPGPLDDERHHPLQALPDDQAVGVPLEPGLYVLSNSHLQDLSWTKLRWLRRSVGDAVDRWKEDVDAAGSTLSEEEIATHFFTTVAPFMDAQGVWPQPDVGALDWSPLPPSFEFYLQSSIFLRHAWLEKSEDGDETREIPFVAPVPPREAGIIPYGTRSLSVLLRGQRSVYYLHRDNDAVHAERAPPEGSPEVSSTSKGAAEEFNARLTEFGGRDVSRHMTDAWRRARESDTCPPAAWLTQHASSVREGEWHLKKLHELPWTAVQVPINFSAEPSS